MKLASTVVFLLLITSGVFYWRHQNRNLRLSPSPPPPAELRVQNFLKLSADEKRKKLEALNDLRPALEQKKMAQTQDSLSRQQADDEKQAELLRQSENINSEEVNYDDLSTADKKIVSDQYRQDLKQIEAMRQQQARQKGEKK